MIFVTVGTHEQPFDRLIEYIDRMKEEELIQEEVVIQFGYSTYMPKYCKCSKFYKFNEMLKFVNDARVIITHGGPASFIMALQVGKTPIVVPRQKKYDEHVNDHQVDFCTEVSKRMGTIITVTDIEDLNNIIINYDEIIKGMNNNSMGCNNVAFVTAIEKMCIELFEDK